MGRMRGDGRMFAVSLFLSWVIGPALMFALAWLFLADEPPYRTGEIGVGLARCIAMVLVCDLAGGDNDRAAILVVFNALFQVAAYALLGWFYLTALLWPRTQITSAWSSRISGSDRQPPLARAR